MAADIVFGVTYPTDVARPADIVKAVGPMADFLMGEMLRVKPTIGEVRAAVAFVTSEAGRDAQAYGRLMPKVRRLVDLVAVAVTAIGPHQTAHDAHAA